jgi:hypothetical protein
VLRQAHQGLGQLLVAAGGHVGEEGVADGLLRGPPVLVDTAGLHRQVPTEATRRAARVGQDLGELVDHRALAVVGAAALLGPDDVHPAVEHAAQVRQVGLLLLGLAPTAAHLVQGQRLEVGGELGGEHAVDPTTAPGHGAGHAAPPRRSFTCSRARACAVDNGGAGPRRPG